jgi:hypothetical protein
MARDLSLGVRRAVLTALEDSPAVTAIVPAERLYAAAQPADPAWPFVRTGFAAPAPFRASGIDGLRVALSLHGFARGPQEDAAAELGAAIAAALDGRVLPLDDDPAAIAHLAWTGSRLARDGEEAGAWQVVVGIEAVVAV